MAVKHSRDLAGDLASGQVPLHAQLCRQAELAIHRAADLARDADSGTPPCLSRFFVCSFAAVPLLAVVAFRHPHGLDDLAVSAANQITLRTVDGTEGFHDLRNAD